MDDRTQNIVEKIFTTGVEIGVIKLASEMGLINENISETQAFAKYGKRQVKDWRTKRWVVGYPTGNRIRSRVYFKRSELETASRMLDMQNIIPATRIKQILRQKGTL